MTVVSDMPVSPAIEPLRRFLGAVRRRAHAWIWVESLAWLGLAVAAAFWITLLFDWWVEPPGWVRAAALAVAACGAVWIIAVKLVGRLAAPLPDASLALLVERHDPRFQDSLSTAISLADRPVEEGTMVAFDRELAARTAASAGDLIGGVRPAALFRGRRLLALAMAAAAALASVAALAAVRADVAGLWVRRMTLLSDEPWPRRVRLEIEGFTGGRRLVARGSDVEIVVRARARGELPDVVDLRSRGAEGWQSRRMGTRGAADADGQVFVHTLTGVGGDMELEVRGGDARLAGLRLEVAEAPALADLTIEYEPPAYLAAGVRRASTSRVVRIPRGSRVRLSCASTKPLSEAVLLVRDGGAIDAPRGDGKTKAPSATIGDGGGAEQTAAARVLAVLGPSTAAEPRTVLTGEIPVLATDLVVSLELTDIDGLVNREPIGFLLSPIPDEPPQVSMTPRGTPGAITPAGRLLFVGTISDDHGLGEAAVALDGGGAPPETGEAPPTVRLPVASVREGAPLVEFTADAPLEVALGPLSLAPGQRLAVAVTALDRCTLADGPQEGRGETWSLDVVTPEALRALLEAREILLRRRFESAIDDLSQARERLATSAGARADGDEAPAIDPLVACAEAASRTAGESADLAEAFRTIHLELSANDMATPEVEERLLRQIAAPLAVLASTDLPDLERASRVAEQTAVLQRADLVLARLRAVLARMIELESYNQLVERLRDVIQLQERIRTDTLEEQKRRARDLLQRP